MEAKILEVLNQWDLSCAEEPQLKKDLAKQIADTLTHQPNNSDKEFTTQNHFYNQPNNSGEEELNAYMDATATREDTKPPNTEGRECKWKDSCGHEYCNLYECEDFNTK